MSITTKALNLSNHEKEILGLTQTHLTPLSLFGSSSNLKASSAILIHQDAQKALKSLTFAAKQAGFDLCIASGFRSYERQSFIIEQKMSGKRAVLDKNSQALETTYLTQAQKLSAILYWSALPGASRHHFGSDLDIYAHNLLPPQTKIQLEPWEYQTGHQQDFSLWLNQNLEKFDFFLPYAKDLGGVAIEPWHISYAPIADRAIKLLTPDLLTQVWQAYPFLGNQIALEQVESIFKRYIINITPSNFNR